LSPRNLDEATKVEYLFHLSNHERAFGLGSDYDEEDADDGDDRDESDDGGDSLEGLYDWAREPCIPLFEKLAPEPEQHLPVTLEQYFDPETFTYTLFSIDGKLIPQERKDEEALARPGVWLNDDSWSTWPVFSHSSITICPIRPDGIISPSPKKVLVKGATTCFFKSYAEGQERLAALELENYQRIKESTLSLDARITRVHGLVKDEQEYLMGILLTYVDCHYVTLACAVEDDTLPSLKRKWLDQITDTLEQLHAAGLVWGDAKPDNVLVDASNDAWIVDFGGGYTMGYVDKELAGTVQGGMQGLGKISELCS
jgi:hypothetical protein